MVKYSRRNIKHKKNSSRRNIKLKNPKHHKKRATTFRKKPFNLRRSTLKKRQHGGATDAEIAALIAQLPANWNNVIPTDFTTNPFNNMSPNEFQIIDREVNRIFAEQQNRNGPTWNQNFTTNPNRTNLRNIQRFIRRNRDAIQAALAPAAAVNLGAPIGVGNAVAAQQQQQLAIARPAAAVNQGGPAPPPAINVPVNQGQVGVANAQVANQGQVPAPVGQQVAPIVPANAPAVNPVPAGQQVAPIVPANAPAVNPVPAAVNPVPGAVNPVPAAAIAAPGLPQTITINITTPPNTIRDLRGDAQLNQNNLAQVDISLAQLVQDFAR